MISGRIMRPNCRNASVRGLRPAKRFGPGVTRTDRPPCEAGQCVCTSLRGMQRHPFPPYTYSAIAILHQSITAASSGCSWTAMPEENVSKLARLRPLTPSRTGVPRDSASAIRGVRPRLSHSDPARQSRSADDVAARRPQLQVRDSAAGRWQHGARGHGPRSHCAAPCATLSRQCRPHAVAERAYSPVALCLAGRCLC